MCCLYVYMWLIVVHVHGQGAEEKIVPLLGKLTGALRVALLANGEVFLSALDAIQF